MRLTNREKIMIAAAVVILIAVGAYYFIFDPFLQEYNFWVTEHNSYSSQLEDIRQNILPPGEQRDLIRTFKRKVELLEKALPPIVHQEQMVVELREIFEENELEVSGYAFGDTALVGSEDEAQKDSIDIILSSYENSLVNRLSTGQTSVNQLAQNAAGLGTAGSEDQVAEEATGPETSTFSVTLSIRGKYEDLKTAMAAVESLEQKVVIDTMAVAKDTTEQDIVIATVGLSYHYYYDGEILEKLNYAFASTLSSFNPFDYIITGSPADPDTPVVSLPIAGTGTTGTTIPNIPNVIPNLPNIPNVVPNPEPQPVTLPEMDFGITMNTPDSIDFDYIVEKSDQAYLALGSNKESERLLIEVTKVNGLYYYRYGNSIRTYPAPDQYEKFDPKNAAAITVEVSSQGRLGTNDVGTGKLELINSTDRPMVVYIRFDDKTAPRAVVETKSGEISVLKVDN